MRSFTFFKYAASAFYLCFSGWCLANDANSNAILQESQTVAEVGNSSVEFSQISQALELVATAPAEVFRSMELSVPAVQVVVSGFGTPVDSNELKDFRGGFDVVKNDMQLSGVVSSNSAVDVASGSNYIANGSFSNSSGFPMVVQNSGSNVLIQNATIINLQYQ